MTTPTIWGFFTRPIWGNFIRPLHPDAAPVETPLFVPVTVAEEPTPAPPEHRSPSARETAPGRIEMDVRSGRLVFHGAVDPGLAAAVVAAAWGRG
ncbi:hypothetical protein [Azospirillum thiophilum]|uniref:hypothetical protein n=1 Tax=Azospirillum thiophilum TaxID=528244 RepID=UPI00118757D1|nr:hypothetical protein [Azospirillum thiophilum]